ncbi:MAG TPA: NINE protein [Gemmataceae bacterium]|jgi:TM2 domain-containing membrane protein YozV|nr:NINE protein [Gemmataceae bacterium]
MLSPGVAYLLWLPGLIGICGLHRFYAGKPITGLIWLFTGGLLFVGQLIDLFLIPSMIAGANARNSPTVIYVERQH